MEALLFDLDGVIYRGEKALPGAVEAIHWVQSEGLPHLFVSNTSSRPRRTLLEKLKHLNITTEADRILIPAVVADRFLSRHVDGPCALFVPEATREDFPSVSLLCDDASSGAAAVVIGHLGHTWSYDLLNRAFRLLMAAPQAQLIALGLTRYAREEDGLSLDVAPFVAALETASSRKALVMGKPSCAFFETALDILGTTPGQTVMIGDDIDSDVGGAQACGLKGALVRSGKFRPEDLRGQIRPDAVLDSLADLPQWWQRH